MRPKSKVLLYCADEMRLSVTRTVLSCDPRLTTVPFHAAPGKRVIAGGGFHAAVLLETAELDHCELLVRAIQQADPWVSVVLVLRAPELVCTLAPRVLMAPSMAELREAVRLAIVRKRGPRDAVSSLVRRLEERVNVRAAGIACGRDASRKAKVAAA